MKIKSKVTLPPAAFGFATPTGLARQCHDLITQCGHANPYRWGPKSAAIAFWVQMRLPVGWLPPLQNGRRGSGLLSGGRTCNHLGLAIWRHANHRTGHPQRTLDVIASTVAPR